MSPHNTPPPHHSLLDTEHRRLVETMDDLSRGCSVYWVLFYINNQYHLHVLYCALPFTCTIITGFYHLHVLYRASTKGKKMFGNDNSYVSNYDIRNQTIQILFSNRYYMSKCMLPVIMLFFFHFLTPPPST